jgi:hypothetical protein
MSINRIRGNRLEMLEGAAFNANGKPDRVEWLNRNYCCWRCDQFVFTAGRGRQADVTGRQNKQNSLP